MAVNRTVRELIEGSLRVVGAFAVGETPGAADTSTALKVLQDLIAERAGNMFVPCMVREAITLVVGQASYTVGEEATADLSTARPEQIIEAWVRDTSDYDYPVKVIDDRNYNAIRDKTMSGRPDRLFYSPTSPNGTAYVYPVPDAVESLYIYSIKSFTEPTILTQKLLDDVSIPRNYHNPLKWMLAEELSPEYGRPLSVQIMVKVRQAEGDIKALNLARTMRPAIIEPATNNRSTGTSILNY
jgi:hypothetical protein